MAQTRGGAACACPTGKTSHAGATSINDCFVATPTISDEENCINSYPGARVSHSGKLCVFPDMPDSYGNPCESATVKNIAQQNNGVYFLCQFANRISGYTYMRTTKTTNMYVMPGAWATARAECESRGGVFSGGNGNWVVCKLTATGTDDSDVCETVCGPGPVGGHFDGTHGTTPYTDNDNPNNSWVTCNCLPDGFWYTAKDLEGNCFTGATMNDETGFCECPPGQALDVNYTCVP